MTSSNGFMEVIGRNHTVTVIGELVGSSRLQYLNSRPLLDEPCYHFRYLLSTAYDRIPSHWLKPLLHVLAQEIPRLS